MCDDNQGRYLPDDHGAFVRLRYLGTNDEHYQWYIENEGEEGGLPARAMHHFCKTDAKSCKAKVKEEEVIHVRRWAPISKKETHDILVSWGYPGLEAPPLPPQEFEDEVDWGCEDEDSPGATSKSRPDLPRRRSRRSPPEESPVSKRADTKRSREPALRPEVVRKQNALDEMLQDDPEEKAQKGLEDKLANLREKAQGQGWW